jgi:hypothetical protein
MKSTKKNFCSASKRYRMKKKVCILDYPFLFLAIFINIS